MNERAPSETSVRLAAIAAWCDHARKGRCTEGEAVDAITGLVAAIWSLEAA